MAEAEEATVVELAAECGVPAEAGERRCGDGACGGRGHSEFCEDCVPEIGCEWSFRRMTGRAAGLWSC